jgi:DNA methylase
MFPLEFPLRALDGVAPGSWCLDPFCGRGTTLYAARLLGINTVGIDVNPVAAALAAAKLVDIGPSAVVAMARRLIRDTGAVDMPDGEFWGLAFAPRTLSDLCRIRAGLCQAASSPSVTALRALMLGVLHGPVRKGLPTYLSNQMPRTYATKPDAAVRFWRARGLAPPEVDVLDVVRRRAEFTLHSLPPPVQGQVQMGDAATALGRSARRFTRIVTSPPYYGMRTYLPDQWLRNWFLGAEPTVSYNVGGQLSQASPETFVKELAAVWQNVLPKCIPNAELWVRFGSLPSRSMDAEALITESLRQGGWRVADVVPAGTPPPARRQANQFVSGSQPVGEVDCRAVLR